MNQEALEPYLSLQRLLCDTVTFLEGIKMVTPRHCHDGYEPMFIVLSRQTADATVFLGDLIDLFRNDTQGFHASTRTAHDTLEIRIENLYYLARAFTAFCDREHPGTLSLLSVLQGQYDYIEKQLEYLRRSLEKPADGIREDAS